jgi:uncharacterized protein YqeY
MLRSALKNREIDRGKDKPLTDQDVLDVIQSGIKQRRESIEQFRAAGRTELIAKEDEEIAILQTFLPKQLSEPELDALVRDAATEVGASSVKDMGKVMKAVMTRVAGRAEGGAVSAAVKRQLERLPPP